MVRLEPGGRYEAARVHHDSRRCSNGMPLAALLGTAAAAWPLAASAQQRTVPVVGVLSPATFDADANRMNGIRQGLKDAGYIEGENVMIECRSAENQLDRL